jgi:hypothetical protein
MIDAVLVHQHAAEALRWDVARMDSFTTFYGLWPLFVILVTASSWIFMFRYRRRALSRAAVIQRWAAARGWVYSANEEHWAHRWPDPPFDVDAYKVVANVVKGPYGPYSAVAFDYTFVGSQGTSSAQRRVTRNFGVAALAMPVALPWVHIMPEGLWDRAAKLLGGQDIEVESEEFNRAFRVRTTDPRFAYDLLNPRTIEALIAYAPLDLRVSGTDIVVLGPGAIDIEALEWWLGLLAGVLERLPTYVWTDRRVSPPPITQGRYP